MYIYIYIFSMTIQILIIKECLKSRLNYTIDLIFKKSWKKLWWIYSASYKKAKICKQRKVLILEIVHTFLLIKLTESRPANTFFCLSLWCFCWKPEYLQLCSHSALGNDMVFDIHRTESSFHQIQLHVRHFYCLF